MCGENNWEGRCNAAQERARKTNEWLSGGEFVSRSSPLICLCGMRPLRAAALPVKPRAIHYRSSFALCPRRLAAAEAAALPASFAQCLKSIPLIEVIIPLPLRLIFAMRNTFASFRILKEAFPTSQKNFRLTPKLHLRRGKLRLRYFKTSQT